MIYFTVGTNLGISSRQSAGNAKHLPVTSGYKLVIFGYQFVISSYQFMISSYKFVIPGHQFVTSGYQFVTFGRSKHPSLKMP